jgi:ABC-type multidrug transport system ATPase subunit
LPEQCSAKAQSSFLTRQQAGQFPLFQSNEAQNSNNYSVDAKTDDLMQRVIREKFSKHTIIAVAHKLDTILDFDKVALLDRGILVEFDNPYDLLEQPESAFYQFYHSTRAEMDEDNCDNVSTSSSQ